MPATAPDTVSPQWFWDRYWQADRVAACLTEAMTGNYLPAIRSAWERFFAGFASGARLLDVGTGNGAVAIIAHETAARSGKRFDIHGVDRAGIDPARFVHAAPEALAAIRFQGRVAVEHLPFPDAHFDGVTGQYALEYTDTERSLPELARVAQGGARLRCILHARDARPVQAASAELEDIIYATDTLRILERARTLMRTAFAFERGDHYDAALEARARAAREDYRTAARALDQRYPDTPDKPMLANMLGSVRHAWDHRREFTLDYIVKGLDAIETEVQAHRARLENMCAVALTEPGAQGVCERLRALGFESVVLQKFRAPGDKDFWGWELTARKGARSPGRA